MTASSSPTSVEHPPAARRRRSSPLLDLLDREWCGLGRRPTTRRTVRSWIDDGLLSPPLPVRDLDDLLRQTQPGGVGDAAADRLLRDLVRLAGDDDLAAHLVLRRILPGVIDQARRRWSWNDPTDPIDTAVGAAWMAIRGFDHDRRPHRIAPALIADTIWAAFRRDARRAETDCVRPIADMAGCAAPEGRLDPVIALAATVRAARRAGVDDADLDFVAALARAGSPSAAARSLGVTTRTIRNRRDVASFRIRRALGPDWIDWADPLSAVA